MHMSHPSLWLYSYDLGYGVTTTYIYQAHQHESSVPR